MNRQIKKIKSAENYCEEFYNNIQTIVSHTLRDDFIKQIDHLDQKKIVDIKNFLSTKLINTLKLEKYDLKLINRKGSDKKYKCMDDIFTLSHYIIDERLGIEADKLYKIQIEPSKILKFQRVGNKITVTGPRDDMADQKILQDLLLSMKTLQDKFGSIENKVDGVIADNRIIKEEINNMKSDIIQINNTLLNDSKLDNEMDTVELAKDSCKKRKFDSATHAYNGHYENLAHKYEKSQFQGNDRIVKKKQVIQGKSSKYQIKTVNHKFGVYLGRIDCSEPKDKIEKLLDHLGLKHCDLSLIETAHTNRKFNSYKFYIPHEQKDIIYKSENWPVGAIIKKFTDYKPFDRAGLYDTMGAYNNQRLHNSTPSVTHNNENTTKLYMKQPTLQFNQLKSLN
jgi:hypothetical protein